MQCRRKNPFFVGLPAGGGEARLLLPSSVQEGDCWQQLSGHLIWVVEVVDKRLKGKARRRIQAQTTYSRSQVQITKQR